MPLNIKTKHNSNSFIQSLILEMFCGNHYMPCSTRLIVRNVGFDFKDQVVDISDVLEVVLVNRDNSKSVL